MYDIGLHGFLGPSGVVTLETNRPGQHQPVFGGRLFVDAVAVEASRSAAIQHDVSHILDYVAVARIQGRIAGSREVHLVILKKIIAGDESDGALPLLFARLAINQFDAAIGNQRMREPHQSSARTQP
jgi:hypothetical protein